MMGAAGVRIALERKFLEHGSANKYAQHLGVGRSFISAVHRLKKKPSKKILDDLGLEKVTITRYKCKEHSE